MSLAPPKAPITPGIPKISNTSLLICLPTSPSLNRLLSKCTMAVSEMAISIGKNSKKTGTSIVPSPNPAKKVSKEAAKAVIGMMISIGVMRASDELSLNIQAKCSGMLEMRMSLINWKIKT